MEEIGSGEDIGISDNNEIFMNTQKRNRIVIIASAAAVAVCLLGYLVYKYVAPFGKIVSYKFSSKLPGVQEATTFPASKDNILTIPSQIISTPQARFTVNLLTQDITSVHSKLRFKKNTREIRLGVRGNETDSFIYHPIYYSLLQDLDWSQLNEGDFTLWQKDKKFTSLYDFVNNVSLEKKTAAYFVDLDKLLLLKPSEVAGDMQTVIMSQLRGSHTLLVRVDQAPLIVKAVKHDMNAYEGEDKVKIIVSKDGKTVAEQTIPDDGIATVSNLKMSPQEAAVTAGDIKPGLYQVDLISEGKESDSLITKLEVNQQKVVFKNFVFVLGDKPSTLWTSAKNISITTLHEAGKQTVKLNGAIELKITEINKKYTFDLGELSGKKDFSLYHLEFPKNDLVVNYDGYITFNKENYFEPEIIKTVPLITLDNLDDVDYVLATYQKAKQDGDWLVAETTFDPKDVKITGDKLYFSLEMPDLVKYGGELEIDSLEIEAKSGGILSKSGKDKDEGKPAVKEEGKKPNIFSRFFGWVGERIKAVGNAIARPFVTVWNWTKGVFGGIVSKLSNLPGKKSAKPTPAPTPTVSASPPPTSKPPTSTPSTTPASLASIELLVRVLNGGGEKGAAASIAAILRGSGFANVDAGNADRTDYKGATVRYRKEDADIVKILESLLKKEFSLVEKIQVATSTPETVIIIGKK